MSPETRALLENSLWAAAQPREQGIRRSKLAGHPTRRRAGILPTTLMVLQMDSTAFPTQRYSFRVILNQIFHSGHSIHVSTCFWSHFCKKSRFFWWHFAHSWAHAASCPQVQHLHYAGGAVTSAQSSSRTGHWGVFSLTRCPIFTDPLSHFHCAAPSFWGGISLVYLLPSLGWVSPQPCWMQRSLCRLRLLCNGIWAGPGMCCCFWPWPSN